MSTKQQDDMREFMLVLRRALLMIVKWIDKRYDLRPSEQ